MLMNVKIHVAGHVAPRTEMVTGWESDGQDYEEKRNPLVQLGIESQLPDGPTHRLSSSGFHIKPSLGYISDVTDISTLFHTLGTA
jgi:hypothetical protein